MHGYETNIYVHCLHPLLEFLFKCIKQIRQILVFYSFTNRTNLELLYKVPSAKRFYRLYIRLYVATGFTTVLTYAGCCVPLIPNSLILKCRRNPFNAFPFQIRLSHLGEQKGMCENRTKKVCYYSLSSLQNEIWIYVRRSAVNKLDVEIRC